MTTPGVDRMFSQYVFSPIYIYDFFLGLIIVSLSLVLFLIGIINSLRIIRSRKLRWKSRERKKKIVGSLILISIACVLTIIADLKLIIFIFFIQKWQYRHILYYAVDSSEIIINYIPGIILIVISIILSIIAIVLFSIRWKKNIFKVQSIIFSGAFILSIIAVLYLSIFKNKVSNSYSDYEGNHRYYVINSSTLNNYNLGFILVIVSLILFIIGISIYLWSILSRRKESKNYGIQKFLQNKDGKKTAIFSFILVCTTISLIIITCLTFRIFDSYIMKNTINKWIFHESTYMINYFGLNYYNRGFLLYAISTIMSLNAIFMFLSKFSPKNSEQRVINSEKKPDEMN